LVRAAQAIIVLMQLRWVAGILKGRNLHFGAAMKKSLVLALTSMVCAFASASSAQQNAPRSADDAAVRQAVGQYLLAHATGSGEHIRNVFHPELRMFFVREGQITSRAAPDYIAGFSGKPAADEAQRQRRIEHVDITGTAAVAKVVLDYPNAVLTDYLSLVKANGEWKVVGKIFHSEPKR
jgi:hypothetical protein